MIRLNNEVKDDTATKKTFYKRRRLLKTFMRLSFVIVVLCLIALLNRNVRDSLTEKYYTMLDPRELDLLPLFCSNNNNNNNNNNNINHNRNSNDKLLEHEKVPHLALSHQEVDEDIPLSAWEELPVRGAYYMVVRNEDLQNAKSVIRSMVDNMSDGLKYPFIFLNNQEFKPEFRKYIQRLIRNSPVYFGKIDNVAWNYPSFIDVKRAETLMLQQGFRGVFRGASLSFRQMLRYHAGLYFHHPLFKNVEFSWRVEPGSEYTCNMDNDPFLTMKMNNKKLGYTITMRESPNTIPTLWKRVQEFVVQFPEYVLPANTTILPWIVNRQRNYNLCHVWSNFEIVDLSFFRSVAYQKFFEYLDNAGNFFYERWGDAPVHTIAAALFLKRDEIHFFNDIGYSHSVASHCPYNDKLLQKCSCDVEYNHDFNEKGCTFSLLMLTEPKLLKEMGSYLMARNLSIKDVKLQAS